MSDQPQLELAGEEAPKPKRTRRSTAKTPKADGAAQNAEAASAAPEARVSADAAKEFASEQANASKKAAARKPRAKTTRAKSAKVEETAVEIGSASKAEASVAVAPDASAKADEAAPKQRRRTSKKAQAADGAAQAAEASSQEALPQRALTEDEAAALIAQARAEAQARAAAQAAASEASSVENAQAASEGEPLPGTTPMYPRRRRARVADDSAEAGASDDSQARARRRPRRSVKAEGGAATLEDAPAQADEQAQRADKADKEAQTAAAEERTERRQQNDQKASNSQNRNGKDRRQQNKQNDRGSRDDRSNHNDRNNRNNRRQRNREVEPSVTREELAELKVADLRARAKELEIDVTGLKKAELVDVVYEATVKAEGFMEVSGVLDILSEGYGFIRTQGYLPGETDCYVGLSLIKRNGLRKGDFVVGQTRPARANEKYAAIHRIVSVNDVPIEELGHRVRFADLTPVYPQERLRMEHGKNTVTARVIDLVAPIGKGQRGLIVSPPKAGKTTILKDIAASISANNPEVHLMCLLIDERPEEVTDMQRSIKGEVISSTFDMPADNHIACAEMVIERAKRLVENGRDVVILLDSITRLARAYNLAQPASGRVLSGGVDSTALYPPKKFLGAARNIENGGSLTILASALIDTGSKMDEVIFEEFKGTGNMELKLDRNLADRRIFPAIDAVASGTRKEELLIDTQVAPLIWAVRRILANMNNTERATDTLIKSIKQTETNQEFLLRMARKAQHTMKDDALEL